MTSERATGQELFDDLTAQYVSMPGVSRGRMFASEGLAVRGKFFAFVGRDGRLILKLPADRANALKSDGAAEAVTIGQRTMREWVGVPQPEEGDGSWPRLIADAHAYVAAITTAADKTP